MTLRTLGAWSLTLTLMIVVAPVVVATLAALILPEVALAVLGRVVLIIAGAFAALYWAYLAFAMRVWR